MRCDIVIRFGRYLHVMTGPATRRFGLSGSRLPRWTHRALDIGVTQWQDATIGQGWRSLCESRLMGIVSMNPPLISRI